MFGGVAAVVVVVLSITEGALSIVGAVTGFAATSAVGYLEYRSHVNKVHRARKLASLIGNAGPEPVRTTRRAPSGRSSGGGGDGTKTKTRKQRACDARCQNSVRPVETCECSCKGATHGTKAPGGQRTKGKKP